MSDTKLILEAINKVDDKLESFRESTGEFQIDISRELGGLGERVEGLGKRVDKLNGQVKAAITTADVAKRLARRWGGRWGGVIAAIITTLGVIVAAFIHASSG